MKPNHTEGGYVIKATITDGAAWCLDNGLATRDRSQAYVWPTRSRALAYAEAHLDAKTPREIVWVERAP